MENRIDYEMFVLNRLRALIDSINRKYLTTLDLIEEKPNNESFSHQFDGTILHKNRTLFKVEIRTKIRRSLIQSLYNLDSIAPIIVLSENRFVLIKGDFEEELDINKLENIIVTEIKSDINNSIESIKQNIITEVSRYFDDKNIISPFTYEGLQFDYTTLRFVFKNEEIDQFFDHNLNTCEESVCRYTSLNSIFTTIINDNQRMFGIAGMNDLEEIYFTDKCIYGGNFVPPSRSDYNNRFILSCSTLEVYDDLTMYRLYADDGKGVCLKYIIEENNSSEKFYIKKVEYADKKGKNPTLELIKGLIDCVAKKTMHIVDFFGDTGWKYFFKPYEYKIENEVRILFSRNNESSIKRNWLITNNNQIINSYVDFSLTLINKIIPIRLEEIVLGPKHPEKDVNKNQYVELLSCHSQSFVDVKVKISDIKNYR